MPDLLLLPRPDKPRPRRRRTRPDQVTGRTYLERGSSVTVLARWGPGGGPRNVLVARQDGTSVVRPFRGLRKAPQKQKELEGETS